LIPTEDNRYNDVAVPVLVLFRPLLFVLLILFCLIYTSY
jgi:hypothetical protein